MRGINKYLFLDIDGVLNSVSWYREEWNKNHVYPQGDFDPKCVELVNRIVEETGCKVVVSSSWRTESNLQSIFDKAGLKYIVLLRSEAIEVVKYRNGLILKQNLMSMLYWTTIGICYHIRGSTLSRLIQLSALLMRTLDI